MKICVLSHSFSPAIGGVETVASTLCSGFAEQGHAVTLVTRTSAATGDDRRRAYRVIRNPTARQLVQAINDCDIALHNNPVARWLWPSLTTGRKTVIAHHTWLGNGPLLTPAHMKRRLLARFQNIAVSDTLAHALQDLGRIVVLPNSFADDVFVPGDAPATTDFLFVGRLVDDKGCDLLLEAWVAAAHHLKGHSLTIIGDGPDLHRMQETAIALNAQRVCFTGSLAQREIAHHMRRCRTLVAPSRWREPFGLVALEAAASGCLVVAPADTGLVEAAGPALVPFQRNDVESLATALHQATIQSNPDPALLAAHLDRHRPIRQIDDYLEFLQGSSRAAALKRANRPVEP